ncbi:hypothetical protein [Microbacterium allomyrinae]|uniref:Uncharacterized protein n=1 Tax=Microbacterium allomyrinae TaxID=2830666 RepID=A0A9X1LTA7_9MICO|nr:hypothetical protein [Microbacterium allomyrinae]MCC2031807.1 hypothetical protein [Microbacterium allomyrinae]
MMMYPTELEIYGSSHPTPDTWILHFGWPTNPIPANGPKANWRGRNRAVAAAKDQALQLAIAARIPEMAKVEAQLFWWYTISRRRDVDNLGGLEKPLFDALVVAGVVRDDTPDLMVKPRAEIRHVNDSDGLVTRAGFTLHIRQLVPLEEIEL